MTKSATAKSWTARWRRWRRAPTDWGDLGTAFGLEMSLRPTGADGGPAAGPAPTPQPWWRRLARRVAASRG